MHAVATFVNQGGRYAVKFEPGNGTMADPVPRSSDAPVSSRKRAGALK